MRTLYEWIAGRHLVGILVRNSYQALRLDPVCGPVFAEHVRDCRLHFETLTDFWLVQTGGPLEYWGRLMQTHAHLQLRATDY